MFNSKVLTLLLALVVLVDLTKSANILCIFTSNIQSHLIIHMSYAKLLADRGHNLTIVTTLPLKDKNPHFHHLYLPPNEASLAEVHKIKSEIAKPRSLFSNMIRDQKLSAVHGTILYEALQDQKFQDFLHNPGNKFDLALMGYFFSDYQLGVGLHFNCPIIVSWMSGPNALVNEYVGNPPEVAYAQTSPMSGLPDAKTFKGRLTNFLMLLFMKMMNIVTYYQRMRLYNDLFPSPQYPSLDEAKKKVSLLLCNSHFSEGIRPNVPAVIEVGGIQIKDKPDPLPRNLQEIFNTSSEHGVIFLSFGTNVGSESLRPNIIETIYRVLAGLKQSVVWKWDVAEKPGDAPNIFYQKWLPQDDILAQPNLRLFITHAGKGGVSESQYHGVPIVAIPIVVDQLANADNLVRDGFGVKVDSDTMTEESLRAAILEVLENPKYKENAKRFSTIYRDRPMTARATALYWIEYVIRHKGAYHMQSPLVHLNSLQYMSLDVVGFMLLVLYLAYKLSKIVLWLVWRKGFAKNPMAKPKAKKQ